MEISPHFHEKNWAQVAQLPTLFRRGVVPDNIIPKDGPFPVPREGENLEELCTEGGGIFFLTITPGGLAQVKKQVLVAWFGVWGICVGNDVKLDEI